MRVIPIVVTTDIQYKIPFINDHDFIPLYDVIPASCAACNSSSNTRNFVLAIDFQSSSLYNIL